MLRFSFALVTRLMCNSFYDHCVEMHVRPNVVAVRSRSPRESLDICTDLIKFTRGASGPHSNPHKKIADNAMAEKDIQLFGATPPVRNQKWPTDDGATSSLTGNFWKSCRCNNFVCIFIIEVVIFGRFFGDF